MITRKKMLKILSGLPLGGLAISRLADDLPSGSVQKEGHSMLADPTRPDSIYRKVGARPLVNARGTVTIIGATRLLPEVERAKEMAMKEYVQLDELMEGLGERLGELTGTEYGVVTSGASSAITVATAGCITGGDPDRIWQLPDLQGLKDEVIIPSYSRSAYDAAARASGARMIPVDNIDEFRSALGPRTAMVMVLASQRSMNGPLSVSEMVEAAKPYGVPVLVDAAAEELRVPNPHIEQGADLVAYSGGKCIRGPQCAGLLLGRKDLVWASWLCSAPHHGFGRGLKVGREEIMGMLTAVEMWFERDHEQEQRTWNSWLESIASRAEQVNGVSTTIRQPRGLSNHFPSLTVEWDESVIPLKGFQMEKMLWDGDPRIAVSGAGSYLPFPPNENPNIRINPSQLEEWEVELVKERVYEALSAPQVFEQPSGDPAVDLSGIWDLEMKFSAATVQQTLVFEQEGSELYGSHTASFASRDLAGYLHGDELLFRSSYTGEGVRLNYEFTGKADRNEMGGDVCMGEYGSAGWRAVRRREGA